ncbi:trypsin-like serine protease [Spirulina sp. 06S082]|uniref:trypsin-like serine protease n=1 Tax=Spirulina sp. 06S082 TaxID=3110248 RepID=UPI002B20CFE5|nr:trypsin-like serine protease [Spirulina sp. 06S082]MEA5468904.1 trypsin-like serine protease [Spirulina sp. 06S082]
MNEQYIALSLSINNSRDRDYIVQTGMGYDGVVLLELPNNKTCTGSLLWSGKHILTAANCFQDHNFQPDPTTVTVIFKLTLGTARLEAKEVFIHPQWNNSTNNDNDNDIAIIELKDVAPTTAERYSIYRRSDEVGQIFTRVGYGRKGTGVQGEISGDRTHQKRFGGNRYDVLREELVQPELNTRIGSDKQLVDDFDGGLHDALEEALVQPELNTGIESGKQLVYDFDSGLRRNDALGKEYSLHGLGIMGYDTGTSVGLLGDLSLETGRIYEAGSTSGDEGSPAFIDGQIAGIASSGRRSTLPEVDITPNKDSSFGEIFFDTRVSAYADFIDEKVNQPNEDVFLLQTGLGLVLLGLMVGAIATRIFRK